MFNSFLDQNTPRPKLSSILLSFLFLHKLVIACTSSFTTFNSNFFPTTNKIECFQLKFSPDSDFVSLLLLLWLQYNYNKLLLYWQLVSIVSTTRQGFLPPPFSRSTTTVQFHLIDINLSFVLLCKLSFCLLLLPAFSPSTPQSLAFVRFSSR